MPNKISWFGKNQFSINNLRSETFSLFKERGFIIEVNTLFKIFKFPLSHTSISSESIINFLFLILFFGLKKKHTFVLNGLGFLSIEKSINRKILFFLFYLNKNNKKKYIFQNYRDYRFFRYHHNLKFIYWIPGSVTTHHYSNDEIHDQFFTILRNKKYQKFNKLTKKFNFDKKISIFSINQIKNINSNHVYKGFIDRSSIYTNYGPFVYLYCYGDGFPKSIIESLVNNKSVILDYNSIINFGVYKIPNLTINKINVNMYRIANNDLVSVREYFSNKIFTMYINILFS